MHDSVVSIDPDLAKKKLTELMNILSGDGLWRLFIKQSTAQLVRITRDTKQKEAADKINDVIDIPGKEITVWL